MRQVLQDLKKGEIYLPELPVPQVKKGHVLIKSLYSLVSLGTEKMLLNFGKANYLDKARQRPDKVKQVLNKVKNDGIGPTVQAVMSKLNEPLPLGYSNVGQVFEVGEGVTEFKKGDLVVSNGPHAEMVLVPENLCARVPDGVEAKEAVFTVVSSIALQGVRLSNPTLGETYVVIGLGLIGLLTIQILKANGVEVIGYDFDPKKVDLAKEYGAKAFTLGSGVDPVQFALEETSGHGVDAVLITASTTSNDPIEEAPKMCRKRGRIILVGVTKLNIERDDFYKKELSFQVSCSYGPGRYDNNYEKKGLDYPIGFVRWTEQRNFQAVLNLMNGQKINTSKLLSKEVLLEECPGLYQKMLDDKGSLGILIKYDEEVDPRKRVTVLDPLKKKGIEDISVALIGCGNFSKSTLLPALKKQNAFTHTIASSSGVRSHFEGERWGFSQTTTDTKEVFNNPDINTVIISTPHNTHAQFVLEALKKGKNIFVEKPLALTIEELEEIKEVYFQNKKPLQLMVGFNRRFSPHVKKIKSLLKDYNTPKSFIYTVNAGKIDSDHWTQDKSIGGGRLVGECCHFVDLLRYLSASPIIEAKVSNAIGTSKDTFSIQLDFEDGSIGTVHYFANGDKSFPKERLEVFCGGKILSLSNFKTLQGFGFKDFKKKSRLNQDKGHENEISSFLEALKGDKELIPFSELYEVSKVSLDLAQKL